VHVERRIYREIRVSRRVKPRMITETLQRQTERLRPLLCCLVLEWIALQKLKKMYVRWLVFRQASRIPWRFILVDLADECVENVLGKRVALTRLRQLHQVSDYETYLHFIRWIALLK